MEEQQPVTALPPVLVEVDKHGTRMTGEYAAKWVFLTYAALFWDELNSHEDVVEQLKIKVAARDGRTIECRKERSPKGIASCIKRRRINIYQLLV